MADDLQLVKEFFDKLKARIEEGSITPQQITGKLRTTTIVEYLKRHYPNLDIFKAAMLEMFQDENYFNSKKEFLPIRKESLIFLVSPDFIKKLDFRCKNFLYRGTLVTLLVAEDNSGTYLSITKELIRNCTVIEKIPIDWIKILDLDVLI